MHVADNCRIGISAISAYEPPGVLDNDWFDGAISRKFVQHTGIRSRRISWEGEVAMGVRAVANLRDEAGCDLRDCAAVVFVSPSFVPLAVAKKHLAGEDVRAESVDRAARRFVGQLGLSAVAAENVLGMNWFCSGYSKALALVRRRILSGLELTTEQFILVVDGQPNQPDHRLRLQADRPVVRRHGRRDPVVANRQPQVSRSLQAPGGPRQEAGGRRRLLRL